jgi:hypothetical protein
METMFIDREPESEVIMMGFAVPGRSGRERIERQLRSARRAEAGLASLSLIASADWPATSL